MATKFGLAGGIPERRVRPIWDAVDSRQYKAALKLCTGLLAKYPNSAYALALEALILERMGKPEEALSTCLSAKDLMFKDHVLHIDDLTLSTLQIVFQRLDRLDLATSCYEHACVKFPNNLEIMMGLFNSYVREYSYVKQQQIAMKMYKIVGEERFLLWAVCSIQLQVISSCGDEKLLALAEALIRKHISSHSLHEPEALLIYISILEQQGKYRDALTILCGDLGSLIGMEVDKLRMQGRLLASSCEYSDAAEVFQKVLKLCPDDWEAFLNYMACLLEDDVRWSTVTTFRQVPSLIVSCSEACISTHLTEEAFDSRISSALSFVQKLQTENDHVRGPYLATIEIEKLRRMNGRLEDGKLLELLVNYFQRFSHLSCFTSDVQQFLHVLTENEKIELLKEFSKVSENASLAPLMKLGQTITLSKIQKLFGGMRDLPIGDIEGISVRMLEMFCKNLPLSKDLDPQETMHGEELLSMASDILVNGVSANIVKFDIDAKTSYVSSFSRLYWRTRNFGYLLMGIMILEFGLNIRRYVWRYKILLLHLYSYLGALPLAYEWYVTLDVKNILLETVSHHILPQLLESPLLVEAADLLREYIKFMDDHLREAADLTFLAYRHRNYSKVIEFVHFKERLQHSCQYLVSRFDSAILHLKQKADSLEDVEGILQSSSCGIQLHELSDEQNLDALTFNEDYQTRPWWTPVPSVNHLKESFEVDFPQLKSDMWTGHDTKGPLVRKAIERKSITPRLLFLSIQVSSEFLKENIEHNGSISYKDSCSELKHLLERYAKSYGLSFNDAIDTVVGSFHEKISSKYCGSDIVCWMNFGVFLNAWNMVSNNKGLGGRDAWRIVNNLIEQSIAEELATAKSINTVQGSNLSVLVQLITEPFSWHMLIIQSIIRSLLPSGKKKKRSGATSQVNNARVQAVRSAIQCLSNSIQLVENWLEDQIKRSEDECLDVFLSHLDAKDGDGPGRILHVLEDFASASNLDCGDRISYSLQSWNSISTARKIVASQNKLLSKFHKLCDSKVKLLNLLKQSL